jgi:type IV secretory pathway TraG/TraD family ATPase VirD4
MLCFAPTQPGKGVGLAVPTLLTWVGSCIVHDIKSENWTLTLGSRSRHRRALLFDPTNPKSAAYNPLLEVRRGSGPAECVRHFRLPVGGRFEFPAHIAANRQSRLRPTAAANHRRRYLRAAFTVVLFPRALRIAIDLVPSPDLVSASL